MLNFCSLYSGSTGNSLFIENSATKILVDVGVSLKKITEALFKLNTNIEQIDAILVTHEHVDHVRSIGSISSKYNIPIYATEKTWTELYKYKVPEENKRIFNINKNFNINDLKVSAFNIPHDAIEPCGFNIFYENSKISIATDLGHINNEIITNLKNSNFLMLESNHDPEILKCSKYPYVTKQRILGEYGHLSNDLAAKTICSLANDNLKHVMLGHLSKENNFPELAYRTVLQELAYNKINLNLNIASPIIPSELIKIS